MTLNTYLSQKYSPSSTRGYENQIKRFQLVLGDQAKEASYTDVLTYIGLLRQQGLHPKSLHNNLFAVKIYFNYLVETKQRSDHPCRYLNLKDQLNKQIPIETLHNKQTLDALYANWQSKSKHNQARDKLIISLLIYQALTVQELCKLCIHDVDLTNGTLRVQASPKNNARQLSLKPNQIVLLLSYLQERSTSTQSILLLNKDQKPFWVGAINRIVNQDPSNKKLTPLKIRQSVIAYLLKENKDIRIVQEFAGHKRAGSTENYKQTGLEELKTTIDRLHPLQ